MITLRKVPFQKTDQDVPTVVEWVPLDLADANGDGTEDIIPEKATRMRTIGSKSYLLRAGQPRQ